MTAAVRSLQLAAPARAPRGPYTYASTPKALYNNAKLIKDPPCGGGAAYANVMHDKRVVRGSTVGAHPLAHGDGAESGAARAALTRRRALARRAARERLRPATPPPAPGRKHHPIQTDYYLEELSGASAEAEAAVQTELWRERPAAPRYCPRPAGADAATQIYPGDLFDFEVEVQPIVEALVGRAGEQALAECAREEELAAAAEQRRRLAERRDAERAERQRLAAQHARLHQEKERRVAEARAAAADAREARERAAAAALAHGWLEALLPSALAGLRDTGYLVDAVHAGVDEEFLPWLTRAVGDEIEAIITSRDLITDIVRSVVEARAQLYGAAGERGEQREATLSEDTPPSHLSAYEEEEER